MEISVETLLSKSKLLFDFLIKSNDKLVRTDVIHFLGRDYEKYYLLIANALEASGKINLKRGPGGIEYNPRRRAERKITQSNEYDIRYYLNNNFIPEDELTKKSPGKEDELYEPLKDYLEDREDYNQVKIHGNARVGTGVWKNPDLVCLSYLPEIKYTVGVFPQITSVEVKKETPTIKDLQQARSYLTFCNSSYICFFHSEYNGRDYDYLVSSLKENTINIWEFSKAFDIGIIVAFKPTARSNNYSFQIVREAPVIELNQTIIETSLSTYFDAGINEDIIRSLKNQIVNFIKQ